MAQKILSTSLNSLKDSSFPTYDQNFSYWVAIKCQTETEGSHQLDPFNYNLSNKQYTWTSPDCQYQIYSLQVKMEKLYTVSKNKTRSWLWLGSWIPDWNWRKWRKPLDHSQVWPKSSPLWLYSGSDKQIHGIRSDRQCLKNYWWRFITLYRRRWSKPTPRKRKAKRQNGCLTRPYM